MKKKNKGFTLIELLAVIVILGLLMAIAIPSVTKYITQSRKKTLASTINNYISAMTVLVNNGDYEFNNSNLVYAVPIECIPLEKGGKNPFGDWSPASDNAWAYVLINYNEKNDNYTYGFTFKDSAGYGMLPTASNRIDVNGADITLEAGSSLASNVKNYGAARFGSYSSTQSMIYYPPVEVYGNGWEGFDIFGKDEYGIPFPADIAIYRVSSQLTPEEKTQGFLTCEVA